MLGAELHMLVIKGGALRSGFAHHGLLTMAGKPNAELRLACPLCQRT